MPTWLSGSLIVFAAVALSLLGLTCFHHFVPAELRRAHNDDDMVSTVRNSRKNLEWTGEIHLVDPWED